MTDTILPHRESGTSSGRSPEEVLALIEAARATNIAGKLLPHVTAGRQLVEAGIITQGDKYKAFELLDPKVGLSASPRVLGGSAMYGTTRLGAPRELDFRERAAGADVRRPSDED